MKKYVVKVNGKVYEVELESDIVADTVTIPFSIRIILESCPPISNIVFTSG